MGLRPIRLALLLAALGTPFSLNAAEDLRQADCAAVTAADDHVEYARGGLVEWFQSGRTGIEQWLEIAEGDGSPLLQFDLTDLGSLTPKVSEDGRAVAFRDASGAVVLAYLDLHGVDAEGREVDAHWERIETADERGPALRLVVAAADHAFPLRLRGRLAIPKHPAQVRRAPQPLAEAGSLAAPANDLCGGAAVVPASGPFPYLSAVVDLTDATTTGDPPSPSCQADISRSVWFAFTPAATSAYTFSVCSDAPTDTTVEDTVLAIYSAAAACAGLAELGGGCDDDTCGAVGLQSTLSEVTLSAGTTYYIVAWSYGTAVPLPGAGDVQLQVVQNPPPGPAPPNDLCDGAEVIPGAGPFPYLTSITTDIGSATTIGDPPAPSCQPNISRSIWYSFTPAIGGRYEFSDCAGGPSGTTVDDTVMALYTSAAACSGLVEATGGCDDDSCGSEAAQSLLAGVELVAGARYYLVVWEYGAAAPTAGNTAIQMRVSRGLAPPNDTCAAAAALPPDTAVSGTTVAALDDTRLPSGSGCFAGIGQTASTAPGGDAAYRFTAPDAGRYSFRVGGYSASANAVVYVASDCPAGGAPATVTACLGAANRSSTSPEEVSCVALEAGQSVYVYVDEAAATSGSAFTIEAGRCPFESEPNGTPALAEELSCGAQGSIAPAGDADFFALGSPEPGSRLFAMVDGAAGNSTDFDLRLTTVASTLEYDDYNNDAPFGAASPNLSGAPLDGAASYLRVSHYSPAGQAEPYRLYASVQPPAAYAAPEVEPNDTVGTATAGAAEYFSGALSGTGDVDLFAFPAVAGELVQIGLDLDPTRNNTPFNGSLALLDSAGTTLLLVNDPASAGSTVPGTGSLTANTPFTPGEALVYRIRSTGMHYARVAASAGAVGDYLLAVSHDCLPRPPLDGDGDGVPDAADCAPGDPTAWAPPGEATGLGFPTASDATLLQWSPPQVSGSTTVHFDLVRSTVSGNFGAPACPVTDTAATSATDPAVPGAAFFYLVRARNSCGGNSGTRSDGTPRAVGSCP